MLLKNQVPGNNHAIKFQCDLIFLFTIKSCLASDLSLPSCQENNELVYGSPNQDRLFQLKPRSSPSMLCGSHGGKLSRSSEHRHRPSLGSNTAQKVYKSDENKHPTVKPRYQTLLWIGWLSPTILVIFLRTCTYEFDAMLLYYLCMFVLTITQITVLVLLIMRLYCSEGGGWQESDLLQTNSYVTGKE